MNPIAIYSGGTVIYWSAVVICLGIAACFALSFALYTANGGRGVALWVFFPLAVALSVVFCRFLHWYCHIEQYAGLASAMKDYSSGGYCLPGLLASIPLAAFAVSRLRLADSAASLLDGIAPGAALCIAFIRLSSLFGSSCRSKISVNTPALQHLPLASGIVNSAGETEYRFATFFIHFLLMLVIAVMLLRLYNRRAGMPMKRGCPQDGHMIRLFLLFYSATEIVMDSTRYDSSYLHFNGRFIGNILNKAAGFISFGMLAAAVSVLCLLIFYSKRSVRANGMSAKHIAIWTGYVLALAAAGVSEYLVQRHGNWYLACYGVMTLCCIIMAALVYCLYLTVCDTPDSSEKNDAYPVRRSRDERAQYSYYG